MRSLALLKKQFAIPLSNIFRRITFSSFLPFVAQIRGHKVSIPRPPYYGARFDFLLSRNIQYFLPSSTRVRFCTHMPPISAFCSPFLENKQFIFSCFIRGASDALCITIFLHGSMPRKYLRCRLFYSRRTAGEDIRVESGRTICAEVMLDYTRRKMPHRT